MKIDREGVADLIKIFVVSGLLALFLVVIIRSELHHREVRAADTENCMYTQECTNDSKELNFYRNQETPQ